MEINRALPLATMIAASKTLPPDHLGDRIMKVNHAGEHGAVNIYRGQIIAAPLMARSMVGMLTENKSHEERHRSIFLAELERRGRRRCRSYWLCGIGGFILGLITGLLGRKAIAATTVAVESVVLGHLEQQMRALREQDAPAVTAIAAIYDEEKLHHDQHAAHVDSSDVWVRILHPAVSVSTEAVIWLGMRL